MTVVYKAHRHGQIPAIRSALTWLIIANALCVSPLLATVFAVGAYSMGGFSCNYVMFVTPMLILAIGVE